MLSTNLYTLNEILRRFFEAFRPLHENYWFALRVSVLAVVRFFECEMCGNCCRYSPPTFSESEAIRIAEYLRLEVDKLPLEKYEFLSKTYYRAGRPCPFLAADNKCSIYEVRGAACISFPHEWLMYGLVPYYCPAVPKALERAVNFILKNVEGLKKAIALMEKELRSLASDSKFKDQMRSVGYSPLVKKLFEILERLASQS